MIFAWVSRDYGKYYIEKLPWIFLQGTGCSKCSKENIDSKRSDETLSKRIILVDNFRKEF